MYCTRVYLLVLFSMNFLKYIHQRKNKLNKCVLAQRKLNFKREINVVNIYLKHLNRSVHPMSECRIRQRRNLKSFRHTVTFQLGVWKNRSMQTEKRQSARQEANQQRKISSCPGREIISERNEDCKAAEQLPLLKMSLSRFDGWCLGYFL